jgi:hypothetical protein
MEGTPQDGSHILSIQSPDTAGAHSGVGGGKKAARASPEGHHTLGRPSLPRHLRVSPDPSMGLGEAVSALGRALHVG